MALTGDGDFAWRGASRDGFGGEVSSLVRNFCDDLRGGGLGGGGGRRLACFFFFKFLSPSRTVELDEEDVRDSLTAARPRGSALMVSTSFGVLPALLRVTGGLVRAGLC